MAGPASPRQVRTMVRTAISSALGAAGWRESRHPYELMTLSSFADGRQIEHLAYAVAVTATQFSREMRQRGQTSTLATSTVGVRFGHRLRADSPPGSGDVDAAYDAQDAIVAAIRGMVEAQGQQGRISSASNTVSSDGQTILGEIVVEIVHHYPLT